MNNLLNRLVRRLISAAMSRRWSSVLLTLAALALAAWGSMNVLEPAATTRPAETGQQRGTAAHAGIYVLDGRVVRIADGDTFTLLVDGRQQQIRMASIDAPETAKERQRPGQPMGQASKKALAGLLAGRALRLTCFEHDQYQRNVCDVPLGDGSTANQQQVATGMAWANMEGRGKYMRDSRIPGLEQQARRARLGLWQEARPVQPWAWRYQCWKKGQC
jgi:endonuclease YncB( thermonuclease family)